MWVILKRNVQSHKTSGRGRCGRVTFGDCQPTIDDDNNVTTRRRDVMVISTEPWRVTPANPSLRDMATAVTVSPRQSSQYDATCLQLAACADRPYNERACLCSVLASSLLRLKVNLVLLSLSSRTPGRKRK